MIKNILLGYNGSRGAHVALSQAVDIARPAKARVHVTMISPLAADEAQASVGADPFGDVAGLRLGEEVGAGFENTAGDESGEQLEGIAELCQREEVFCTFNHHYGDPAQRLSALARVANLLVVGRRDEPGPAETGAVGRVARALATRPAIPTLFTDREHLPLKSATLFYEPREAGGRALAIAGEVAQLLNITLNVVCLGHGEVDAPAALEEVRTAVRAYHVDGELTHAAGTLTAALQNTALSWNDPLVIVPSPPRQLLFGNIESTRVALGLPNTNLLLVP
jgi:nucleotide-binding universal stress UspA family protein